MAEQEQSIIIKKIKKVSGGHHGGAWKVAYADFVTAMMAFFLLLWLLSATSESTKEGIAEYFTPTIGLKDSMGIGFEGGEMAGKEGQSKSDKAAPGLVAGSTQQGPVPQKPDAQSEPDSMQESKLFENAQEQIKKTFEEDPNFRDLKDNIIVEQTPEGLRIRVLDLDKFPLFEPGKSTLTQAGQKILRKLSEIIIVMPNRISITGHTDASGYSANADYTNWELSADRANASRRFLQTTQMEAERVFKVVGMADRELLDPTNPKSARNRRMEIILLRGSYLDLHSAQLPAARELLSVPKTADKSQETPKTETESPTPSQPAEQKLAEPVDENIIIPPEESMAPAEKKPNGATHISPLPGIMPQRQ